MHLGQTVKDIVIGEILLRRGSTVARFYSYEVKKD